MLHLKKALFLLLFWPQFAFPQINSERVMLMGRNALFYEDYVLSMQYFNMVINAKPYLSEPYFYRGLAKFYLEDFSGASADCSEAIARNPFVARNYELLGVCLVNQKNYEDALDAYKSLLRLEPDNRNAWYNSILCEAEAKRYEQAQLRLDTAIVKWPDEAQLYTLRAQVYFQQKDTLEAEQALLKAVGLNAYEEHAWEMLAILSLSKGKYQDAEKQLTRAIAINNRNAVYFVNRALARYHQKNLRGAMDDYDEALVIDSKSYLAHFNRGLLRAQVGDDNRAIEDFNYVLELEPDNEIALFNRALMRHNTGDYQGALKDLTAIINDFPTFWDGYQMRAAVYRRLGMIHEAERDEFKVMKARLEARYQQKNTLTAAKTRKKSSRDLKDYDKLVEEDSVVYSQTYTNDYRGKVQNRQVEMMPEGLFVLTYHPRKAGVGRTVAYHSLLEQFNSSGVLYDRIFMANHEQTLDQTQVTHHFNQIERLSEVMEGGNFEHTCFLKRALEFYTLQNYDAAMQDINKFLEQEENHVLGHFIRAQIKIRQMEILEADNQYAPGVLQIGYNAALSDLEFIIGSAPDFKYAYYNMGYVYFLQKKYEEAERAWGQALQTDPYFAEALFSRGVARAQQNKIVEAVDDWSQAGELGLYESYGLIKRYSDYRK